MDETQWIFSNLDRINDALSSRKCSPNECRIICSLMQTKKIKISSKKSRKIKIGMTVENLINQYLSSHYHLILHEIFHNEPLIWNILFYLLIMGSASKQQILAQLDQKNQSEATSTFDNLIEQGFIVENDYKFDAKTEKKANKTVTDSYQAPERKKIKKDETKYFTLNFSLLKMFIILSEMVQQVDSILGSKNADYFKKIGQMLIQLSKESFCLSQAEIINQMSKKENKDCFMECQDLISILTSESFTQLKFLKVSNSFGVSNSLSKTIEIDWLNCIKNYVHQQVISFVGKVYGNAGIRIIEALNQHGPLAQNDLESHCLYKVNNLREVVHHMLNDSVLSTMEFSKTTDFNPSKTTYLIKLNYPNLANTIYKRIQKSIINIYHLKAKEHDENCTMLQKYSKIKQFINNTTDPELRNGDIESFLTKNEQENLNSFKKNIEYLDLALLRISIPYIFFKAFLNI